jgi:hypothetical protein
MPDKIILFFKNLTERQIVVLLILVTFGLRLYAVLMARGIANDSAAYGFMARDFLKGLFAKGLAIPGHPLYPLLISLFSPGTAHAEITGRLLSLFFGTFALLPLFYLVKQSIGRKEAILSALFYTFHPYLVAYSGMFLTEATYWGVVVLSVYFFWTGLQNANLWKMGLSGLFLGLAYLTRPEGIGYVLVYLAWIVGDSILKKKWFKAPVLIGALVSSVVVMGIPYVIYIHQETGQWLISKKALDAQSQLLKKDIEKIQSTKAVEGHQPEQKNSKIGWITRNILHHLPSVIYHYLRAYHFSLWLFLFFGLIRVRKKLIPYELFLASLVLFHLVSLSTFTPSTIRFSVPLIPLSLFWAGAGMLEMKGIIEKIKIPSPEKAVVGIALFVILIQLPQGLTPERRHRADQKRIGLWLKQHTLQDAIIMSSRPQEAFYAEREWVMFPVETLSTLNPGPSYDEVIRLAKAKGVRYILVSKQTFETNPGFIKSIQPVDLKEIARRTDQSSILYEVIY